MFNLKICLFFFECINDFVNKRSVTINYINLIKDKFDEIKEINEIPLSEKIRALNALFFIYNKIEKVKEIKDLNIKYYITSNRTKNYILDKVYTFLNKFISNINEKSAIYENLLFIDGGYGYYNKKLVYTYDMTNLEVLKSHLDYLLPQILIFYYMENEEIAFTTPEFGGIAINEYHILNKYPKELGTFGINYDTPKRIDKILTEEQINDISMDIVLDLIHESMGHKKFLLSGQGIVSPKKIFKKKELIELKYIKDFTPNNVNTKDEYILTSKKNKGDSGHFIELSYGKCDDFLITKLLFEMKNKGKLINRPDLFTDSGETLKMYISLRRKIEKKKITYNFNNTLSIENEIIKMKSLVDECEKSGNKTINFELNEGKNENKHQLLQKKEIKILKILILKKI